MADPWGWAVRCRCCCCYSANERFIQMHGQVPICGALSSRCSVITTSALDQVAVVITAQHSVRTQGQRE